MLTMEEIENISFRRSGLGGYKVEDVDTFVDGVIEKVKQLETANKEMQARVDNLTKQVMQYESQADSVQNAIITAEKTAKKLVRDATIEADTILSEARAQAQQTTRQADERAAVQLSASELRAQTILSSALSRSAAGIDENNRIIEQQKQYIIQIQSEVTRFRDALIDSYKEHLRLINSLPKAEEFRQYQTTEPVRPETVEQEVYAEADRAVEEAQQKTEIQVEMVDTDKIKAISEEIRTNKKAQAALAREQENEKPSAVSTNPSLEDTIELPKLPLSEPDDSKDSNLDDIQAVMHQSKPTAAEEEPKPASIDDLIFGKDRTEEKSVGSKNNRQPIGLAKSKETLSDEDASDAD
ncbi:MAG: DivIVA domain-containing protein [Acutalibacteraceae bacterium]|nr:DivIVA domain-containing protein [Acutalibacteraceae bacterium]